MEVRKQPRKTWHKLINTSEDVLVARYLKKLKDGENMELLKKEFLAAINTRIGNTDEFEFGAVVALEGANLNSFFENLTRISRVLVASGIKLNFKNILEDINEILNENALIVFQARKNIDSVHPAIKKIFDDFINEILTERTIEYTLKKLDANNSEDV